MSYGNSDFDKTTAISVRVSKNDLADLELIREHLKERKSGYSYRWEYKRSDAIWAAVQLYKQKYKLKRQDEAE